MNCHHVHFGDGRKANYSSVVRRRAELHFEGRVCIFEAKDGERRNIEGQERVCVVDKTTQMNHVTTTNLVSTCH